MKQNRFQSCFYRKVFPELKYQKISCMFSTYG